MRHLETSRCSRHFAIFWWQGALNAIEDAYMTDRATVYARIIELMAPLNAKNVPLQESTSFAGDLEMDSLTVMDLVASMEDEWDIVMPLNMLPDLETIGQVADAVTKLVNK